MDVTGLLVTLGASAISGVAGLFIQRHLFRSKPTLNVIELSFDGDVVEVSEEIQNLSRKCNWTNSVNRFLSYEELSNFEIKASQISAVLQQEKETIDQWLENLHFDSSNGQFSRSQVLRTPAVADIDIVGRQFQGMLKRREFPELPVTLEQLKEMPDLLPLNLQNGKYTIHCGEFGIPFQTKDYSEDMLDRLELLVNSIAKGNIANLIKLHEHFSSYAGSQVYNYDKLLKGIKKHLIEHSKLSLTVSLSNVGNSPVIIKPYFVAKLYFGEQSQIMVLENIRRTKNKEKFPYVDTVRSDKYQASHSVTNYVSLPAGKSMEVTLVSSDGLGSTSNDIAEFYELGGLKGQVFAQSEDGKKIVSNITVFSKNITEADKKKLLQIAT